MSTNSGAVHSTLRNGESSFSLDIVFFAELLAGPVHPAPKGDGEDEVDWVLQRADDGLAEEGHHGHHDAFAQQHGDEVALLVKIGDAEGEVHEGRRREGQHRQHEQ